MNKNQKCPNCGSTQKTWCSVMEEYICKNCLLVLPDEEQNT
jgi:transcription initiation factor TFIIIB Brf1 subunit/transcription initiation factor TFIIB